MEFGSSDEEFINDVQNNIEIIDDNVENNEFFFEFQKNPFTILTNDEIAEVSSEINTTITTESIDFVSDDDFDVFNNFEIEDSENSTVIGDKYTDESNTEKEDKSNTEEDSEYETVDEEGESSTKSKEKQKPKQKKSKSEKKKGRGGGKAKGGVRGRGRRGKGRGKGKGKGRGKGRGKGKEPEILELEAEESETEIEVTEVANFLPQPPEFDSLKNKKHEAYTKLPDVLEPLDVCTPINIFSLFFTHIILNLIVENTNEYAKFKNTGEGRPWTELILSELKIFLAILIYMGLFKMPSIEDYWNNLPQYPQHPITRYMSLLRFQQIKRFLHISPVDSEKSYWFSKLEPLATHIQSALKKYYIPSSNIAIDEIIARFSGRSSHTFRIKHKPTPQGYKIYSLCDAGYTYTFIFLSRTFHHPHVEKIQNLSQTSCEVWHLLKQLPKKLFFNVYMDNFFSNINLFSFLRNKNIGACGTVRTNSSKFPDILKIKKQLEWNTLSGVVIDNVLSLLWYDNGPVTMLTTIYEINSKNHYIKRERR
jgi:hypothetical protein